MNLFDSPWLINMLAKASNTPQGRLLSLFDILDDWVLAPHVEQNAAVSPTISPVLINFCTEQAKSLGAQSPEVLGEHIVLIAHSAVLQAIEHPGSNSLMHAKKAAAALIQAQTHKPYSRLQFRKPARSLAYLAATALLLVVGAPLIGTPWEATPPAHTAAAMTHQPTSRIAKTAEPMQSNPITAIDAARMYAKYEQMRQGTCQFAEVLQIPDKHRSVYLENVVGGKLPSDLNELAIANYYLEKVRCNFTPTLMATSK